MKTAKNPEKKRFRLFSYLFNTRMGTMIFSIITAIFLWFAISINLYPTTPRTISHIPLTVDITGTAAELNGYSVIDYSVKEITVQIEGNRSQVGNLDANDMIATPVVENVTSSDSFDIPDFHIQGNNSDHIAGSNYLCELGIRLQPA